MDDHKIITIEPDKRSGKPCIRGARMTVTDVLEYMAGGMRHHELLGKRRLMQKFEIRNPKSEVFDVLWEQICPVASIIEVWFQISGFGFRI